MFRVRKVSSVLSVALACLVMASVNSSLSAASIDAGVSGNNVVFASHSRGEFIQVGPGQWKEILDGRTGYFAEQGRDEWSVYLVKNNGVRVQIDLWRKMVVLTSSGAPRDLYAIQAAKSANGSNVSYVRHACGQFTHNGSGRWTEVLNGSVGYFVEQGRDEWSVYLIKDNGVRIQLDLWTNKVYQLAGREQIELYTINGAS